MILPWTRVGRKTVSRNARRAKPKTVNPKKMTTTRIRSERPTCPNVNSIWISPVSISVFSRRCLFTSPGLYLEYKNSPAFLNDSLPSNIAENDVYLFLDARKNSERLINEVRPPLIFSRCSPFYLPRASVRINSTMPIRQVKTMRTATDGRPTSFSGRISSKRGTRHPTRKNTLASHVSTSVNFA